MPSFYHRPLSRRHLLKGAGIALALPLLDAMGPFTSGAPSTFKPLKQSLASNPRVIFCYVANGVNILDWVPKSEGKNYQLSPTLEVMKEFRSEFSVLTGLGHPSSQGGHTGADTWLTAANLKSRPGFDYTNTISIDQVIADQIGKETRFTSLQLGDMSGTGAAFNTHSLSFAGNGSPIPAENSPRRLFERLFISDSTKDKSTLLERYAIQKSILDDLAGETKSLERKLGATDRKKLDEYLISVRQTEKQVERLQKWVNKPKVKVPETGLQLASKNSDGHDRAMYLDVMLELSYLAFQTDTTRVITFEWAREASGWGQDGENHHELTHHGGDPGMLTKLARVDRFHLSHLARFLGMLKATSEREDNMLDRTIVLYGSGMNSGLRGDHSPKNLPILVAGGMKLGLKQGQHLAFNVEKHPPLSNVLLTISQKMGVEKDRFADSTGTLTGLV